MKRKLIMGLGFALALVGSISVARADSVSGTLYYTRYSGSPNVRSVDFSFDGASTFTLGTPTTVGTTLGADGIAGDPQNSDLLFVGGQGTHVNTISRTTGVTASYSSAGVSVYHLEVSDSNTLYGAAIPGGLVRFHIEGDGSLSSPEAIALSGSNSTITQLITTPTGYFYTSSGGGGTGNFGTLSFPTSTTATTVAKFTSLPAAHGGVYDPFSDTIIVMGDSHITQISADGSTILSDLDFSGQGLEFDQGTVDGSGHLFVASNFIGTPGNMFFMDYSATGDIAGAGTFSTFSFLDSNLDDIAPLVGGGTTASTVPVPAAAWMGFGLLGLLAGFRTLRRRKAYA